MEEGVDPPPPPLVDKGANRHTTRSRSRSNTRRRDNSKRSRYEEEEADMKKQNHNQKATAIHTRQQDDNISGQRQNFQVSTDNEKISNNETNIKLDERILDYVYDSDHKGPYVVFIDRDEVGGERIGINIIHLSRILKQIGVQGVLEAFKIGFARAKVLLKSGEAANALAGNGDLIGHGYKPKIFPHFVSKIGIIFGVPTDIPEQELKSVIESDVEILKAVRVTRREKEERVPTQRIKLYFKGLDIPRTVRFFEFAKKEVQHFISFSQCFNCMRFNHFSAHCRQRIPVCRKCFFPHAEDAACAEVPSCTNCNGDHSPLERKCPARIKAYQVKKIMTMENITRKEAVTKYSSIFANRFEILEENMDVAFPPLRNRGKGNTDNKGNVGNSMVESAKFLHSVNSFAKVTKNLQNRKREEQNAKRIIQEHKKALEEDLAFKSPNGSAFRSRENEKSDERKKETQTKIDKVAELGIFLETIAGNVEDLANGLKDKLEKGQQDLITRIKDKVLSEAADIDIYLMRKKRPGYTGGDIFVSSDEDM